MKKEMGKEFFYDSNIVRTQVIKNEPWFVAKDVCNILGLGNPSEVLKKLDDDQKLVSILSISTKNKKLVSEILIPCKKQKMLFVSESGLYNLIFRSNKPEAIKFRRWITVEVIPEIRKTGSYLPKPKQNLLPVPVTPKPKLNEVDIFRVRKITYPNGGWSYFATAGQPDPFVSCKIDDLYVALYQLVLEIQKAGGFTIEHGVNG